MNRRHFVTTLLGTAVTASLGVQARATYEWTHKYFDFGRWFATAITITLPDGTQRRQAARTFNDGRFSVEHMKAVHKEMLLAWARKQGLL